MPNYGETKNKLKKEGSHLSLSLMRLNKTKELQKS